MASTGSKVTAIRMTIRPAIKELSISVVLLVIASIVLALPLLLQGPLPNAHDGAEHQNFIRHFSEQFWNGNLYPRWLLDMNHGLGSPSYFVYPPLPAYVYVAIEPMCRLLHLNAFNIAAWLSIVCSGLAAFLWLCSFANTRVAFVCATLYMLLPYHLAIDFYRRFALSECWALAWMPLLLYFTIGIVSSKRRAVLGFAVTFACLILSHLISVAMFFWLPALLAVLESERGRKVSSAVRVCGAMLFGSALSAVYLLPAIANAKYMPAARLMLNNEGYLLSNQLAFLGKGLIAHSTGENFLQTISQTIAATLLVSLAAGAVALVLNEGKSRKQVFFWLAVACVSTLMMCKPSAPIWQHIPLLHEAIQYPWRFNALLCIATTALLTLCLSALPAQTRISKASVAVGVLIIVFVLLLSCGRALRFYAQRGQIAAAQPMNEHDGWFPAWVTPGTDQKASLTASEGPEVLLAEGVGSVQPTLWQPRRIAFDSNTSTGGWVRIRQFFYPTWQAQTNGTKLAARPVLPEGMLEVQVPAGAQHVEVSIPPARTEVAGRWLSLASLLLCVPLTMINRRTRQESSEVSSRPFGQGRPPWSLQLVSAAVFLPWALIVIATAGFWSALALAVYALVALAVGSTLIVAALPPQSRVDNIFLASALGVMTVSAVGALWLRLGFSVVWVPLLWLGFSIPGAVALWRDRGTIRSSSVKFGRTLAVLSALIALVYFVPAARNDAVMHRDGSFQWMYVDTQHFYAIAADLKNADGVPKGPGTTTEYLRYHFGPYVPAAAISRITGLSVGDSLVRVTRAASLWSLVLAVFGLGGILSLKATGKTFGGILCVAGLFFYGALLALFTNEVNSASHVSGAILFVIPNVNVLADGGPFSHLVLGHSMLHGLIAITSVLGLCLAVTSKAEAGSLQLLSLTILPALAVPMNSVAALYCFVAVATLLIWSQPKHRQTWFAVGFMVLAFLVSWFWMGFHNSSDAAGVAMKQDIFNHWWTLLITFAVGLGVRAIGFRWVAWPIRDPISALVLTSTLSMLAFALLIHLGDDNERYGIYFLQCLFSIFAFSRIEPLIGADERRQLAGAWLSITAKGLVVLFVLGALMGLGARLMQTHTGIHSFWLKLVASLAVAALFALLGRLVQRNGELAHSISLGVLGLLALGFLAWIPPVMNFGLDRMKMDLVVSPGEVCGLTRLNALASPSQVFATNRHSVPGLALRTQRSYAYTALSERPVLLEGYLDRGISSLPSFPDLLRNNDLMFSTTDPQTLRSIAGSYNVKWLVAEPGTDISLPKPLPGWIAPQQDTCDLKIYRID